MTPEQIDELVKHMCCGVTGNPCGTDTRPIGKPCSCPLCQAHSALESLSAQAAKDAERIRELENLCERLKLEAQIHSGEARAHKSTVHECYQIASGASGELGNWHGATPVRDRISILESQLADIAREKDEAEFHANEMNAACDQLTLERDVAKERVDVLESQLKSFREAAEIIHKEPITRAADGWPRVNEKGFDALMSALQMVEKKDGE